MRFVWNAAMAAGLGVWGAFAAPVAAQEPGKTASAGKDTPAAERTRSKLLKVKVTVDLKAVPLRDVLKEFAAQVDMQVDRPVMWTYPADVPASQPVTYRCNEKPLDAALDELFTTLKLGYIVVSEEENLRDGWVRVLPGTERGYPAAAATPSPSPQPPAGDDGDEEKAASRLAVARKLIDGGMAINAKSVLMLVINKYPKTKAAAEAKTLLEKLKP